MLALGVYSVEHWFGRVDDAVVRWGEDDDIAGIIIQALREGADMVRLEKILY